MDFLLLLPLLSVCLLSCSGTTSGATVVKVREGSEAVLPCFIRPVTDIKGEYFNWRKVVQKDDNQEVFMYDAGSHYNNGRTGQDEQFKGRVSHFPEQLQSGDASIVIRDTKLSDNGTYTCDFALLQPDRQTYNIELVVAACPKPSITLHDMTKDWALIQCDVHGASPKPKVEWQDSDGNILHDVEIQDTEREGRFYITLNTTVTKTGRYRCVATQLEICHEIPAKIFVRVNGPETPKGFPTGHVVVSVLVTLLVVGVVLAVLYKCWNTRNSKKGSQKETERDEEKNSTESVVLNKKSDTNVKVEP